jgi:hypothetical protein
MELKTLTEINTSLFTYSAKNKRFISEISTIRCNIFGQIYDDACDAGFVLVSQKTGKKKTFFFINEETKDGEIVSWNFKDTKGELEIIIYND